MIKSPTIPSTCFYFIFLACFLLSGRVEANVLGTDEQNFNPSASRNDFLVVESGNTLDKGQASNDFYIDSTSGGMLFTRRFDPSLGTDVEEPGNTKSFFNLGFAYGFTDNFDMSLALSVQTLGAGEDEGTYLSRVSEVGLSSMRLNAKYRFYKKGYTSLAALLDIGYIVMNDTAYTGDGSAPHMSAIFAGKALLYERLVGAFNFGYKHRSAGGTIRGKHVTPMFGQFLYSAALAYIIPSIRTKLILEGYGSSPMGAVQSATERPMSNFEGLVGLRFFIQKDLHLTIGGTSGFYRGLATPDTRFFLGLRWLNKENKENEYPYIYETNVAPDHEAVAEESLGEVNIYFSKGVSSYASASKSEMKKAYDFINKWKGSIGKMLLIGHTDHTGARDANQILSETRANVIKNHIVKQTGISPSKIEIQGFGEMKPVGNNNTEAGRALNRRVLIQVFE